MKFFGEGSGIDGPTSFSFVRSIQQTNFHEIFVDITTTSEIRLGFTSKTKQKLGPKNLVKRKRKRNHVLFIILYNPI